VNKANGLVSREIKQSQFSEKGQIEIQWQNDNEFNQPKPPIFWGGDYLAYIRVIIPKVGIINEVQVADNKLTRRTAEDLPVSVIKDRSVNKYEVEYEGDLQSVGFWILVPAGEKLKVKLGYDTPLAYKKIMVRRQPGVENYKYVRARRKNSMARCSGQR
jgi:hypothetical protein